MAFNTSHCGPCPARSARRARMYACLSPLSIPISAHAGFNRYGQLPPAQRAFARSGGRVTTWLLGRNPQARSRAPVAHPSARLRDGARGWGAREVPLKCVRAHSVAAADAALPVAAGENLVVARVAVGRLDALAVLVRLPPRARLLTLGKGVVAAQPVGVVDGRVARERLQRRRPVLAWVGGGSGGA